MVFTSRGEYKREKSENASHAAQDKGSEICVPLSCQETECIMETEAVK